MDQTKRIDALHAKMARLVEEFAEGYVNRAQFHSLYERFQRQLVRETAHFDSHGANNADWLDFDENNEEDTVIMRSRLTAQVDGLAIFSNQGNRIIATLGNFTLDPALLKPLLTVGRHVTSDTPLANVRSTSVCDSRWLGIVYGRFTTLFALYSLEPCELQLTAIEYTHRDFETANRAIFKAGLTAPDALVYTFFSLIGTSGFQQQKRPG